MTRHENSRSILPPSVYLFILDDSFLHLAKHVHKFAFSGPLNAVMVVCIQLLGNCCKSFSLHCKHYSDFLKKCDFSLLLSLVCRGPEWRPRAAVWRSNEERCPGSGDTALQGPEVNAGPELLPPLLDSAPLQWEPASATSEPQERGNNISEHFS